MTWGRAEGGRLIDVEILFGSDENERLGMSSSEGQHRSDVLETKLERPD